MSDTIQLSFSSERNWNYTYKSYGEVVVWRLAQWVETQSRDCWKTSLLWKLQARATGRPPTVNIDIGL